MATSSPRNLSGNVRSDMDIPYPEHLSRLNRHLIVEFQKGNNRNKRSTRTRSRYRTQPVTFDEIQEVDEEITPADSQALEIASVSASVSTSKLEIEGNRFPNVLGSKRKKSKPPTEENISGEKGKYDKSNGESAAHQKSIDQLRWIERKREGSI